MPALGFHPSKFSLSQFRPIRGSFQAPLTKQASTWSARPRQREIAYHLGLGLDRKAAERDASVTTSEESGIVSEGGSLELVDTDGIFFEDEDENDINGMLRQPRNYLEEDVNNWQMFAAEEGARPSDDDETESDSEMEDGPSGNLVRRRKAEEALPFPDSAAMNWSAADKEKVQALHAFKHR